MSDPSETVDVVLIGPRARENWALGRVVVLPPTLRTVSRFVNRSLDDTRSDVLLFWDPELGMPEPSTVANLLRQPGDVWHAGLLLGTSGLPRATDYVAPTWMYNRDPDPHIEATSWRISLRACLIRKSVMRRLGALRPEFGSLDAAGLEMGHRFIQCGAFVRHTPGLLPSIPIKPAAPVLSVEDELRFALYRFGPRWARWAALRALVTGDLSRVDTLRAGLRLRNASMPSTPRNLLRPSIRLPVDSYPRVSVLIPTLGRYPYLRTLLGQLRDQTVRPMEVIIVDQTELSGRDSAIVDDYPDLPIRMVYMDEPGQCSSRNTGLRAARGDYILMADDDIEVGTTFIEDHLATVHAFGADSSSGVAIEVGAPAPDQAATGIRTSHVFPAGITLVSRQILERSGLFDLAYERAPRADGDLGMRVYLQGGSMVLNPRISVLHHRAPRGGLRVHGARVTTRESSRKTLMDRHLPSASEIYLVKRYFNDKQIHESNILRVLGTFSLHGPPIRRMLKAMIGLLALPHTLRFIRDRTRDAHQMLAEFPQVARFDHLNRRSGDEIE